MTVAHDLVGRAACSNPGLALTRLAPPLKSREWATHLASIVEARPPTGYDNYFQRLRARTPAGPKHRRVLLATALAPVMCGMGERTPGENGLTLHPVYGVPYLPGSSLKGILRAWVLSQSWGDDWRPGGKYFATLFGEGGHDGAAAVVDMLDALPVPSHAYFTLDVLTPHFSGYYKGDIAPLGWEKPIPVHFLTAAKDVLYRVVLEGDPAWLDEAAKWLSHALSERGIGSKSRAGYGRFTCELITEQHPDERKAVERSATARLTKAERIEATLRARGRDAFRGELEKWLNGEEVSPSLRELLPSAPASQSAALLAPVRLLAVEWRLRDEWVARIQNPKSGEKKTARARKLLAAWDNLFPPIGSSSPPPSSATANTSDGSTSKFGTAPWVVPQGGKSKKRADRLAKDFAGRAGHPNAPSREAVNSCLEWLRVNGGKQGQINLVRRAYDLDGEST